MPINQSSYAIPREEFNAPIREFNTDGMGFIAEKIFPIREVMKESATISVIVRENMKRADNKHANGSAFNRIVMKTEDTNYACKDYGLEHLLTRKDRELYASDFDAEMEVVETLLTKMKIEQEIRANALVFNTSTYTGDALFKDNSATPWDTTTTDIPAQIEFAVQKVRANTGYHPDTMVLGAGQIANLIANTKIQAKYPVMNMPRQVLLDSLATLFGLNEILIGGAIYDSAQDGQSFAGSDIWVDDYAFFFKKNTGSLSSGGLGRTMLWTPITNQSITVESYVEPQSDAEVFRTRQYVQEKIFDPYFGFLMKIDA